MIRALVLLPLMATPAAAFDAPASMRCDFGFRCIEARCDYYMETATLALTGSGAITGFVVTGGKTHPAHGNMEPEILSLEFSDPNMARFLTVHQDGRAMMRLLQPPLRSLFLGNCKEVS